MLETEKINDCKINFIMTQFVFSLPFLLSSWDVSDRGPSSKSFEDILG